MAELSLTPVERARKAHARVLQALQEPGTAPTAAAAAAQGCPGQFVRVRGIHARICFGCALFGAVGAVQIEPAAHRLEESLVWACPNRVPTVPADTNLLNATLDA